MEEELLKEAIEQALEEGNITVSGSGLSEGTESGFSKMGVMNTAIAEEEVASVIAAVLTEEEKVDTPATVKVSFEIPEEYRSVNGEPVVYEIVRVYTDENGNVCTEVVDYTIEGNVITMYAQNTSEYALIVQKNAVLSADAEAQCGAITEPQQVINKSNGLGSLWLIVLLVSLTALSLSVGYILGKKSRKDSQDQR